MITKTTMVVIFNLQNSHLLTLSLPTEEVFQVNGQIGRWQIFQLSIFILSREKCQHQSHWIRNFRFFFWVLWFSSPSRKVWTSLSISDTDFFKVFSPPLLEKALTNNLYWESWRLCCSFINLTEWRQRRVTCQQLIGYINTREKIRYFFTCVVAAFLSAGNHCITPQFVW